MESLSLAVMLRRPTRHPDHCVVRYSYGEALRPRTLNLRCSLLIRTACSSVDVSRNVSAALAFSRDQAQRSVAALGGALCPSIHRSPRHRLACGSARHTVYNCKRTDVPRSRSDFFPDIFRHPGDVGRSRIDAAFGNPRARSVVPAVSFETWFSDSNICPSGLTKDGRLFKGGHYVLRRKRKRSGSNCVRRTSGWPKARNNSVTFLRELSGSSLLRTRLDSKAIGPSDHSICTRCKP